MDSQPARTQRLLDHVSTLLNRCVAQSHLQELLRAAAGRNRPLALLLMQIDNSQNLNGTSGRPMSDQVLELLYDQLELMTEELGIVGRFGGDGFIVLLPDHSQVEAEALAHVLHDWLTNVGFTTPERHTIPVLVSFGLATFPDDGDSPDDLLTAAQGRLDHSRRSASGLFARLPSKRPLPL